MFPSHQTECNECTPENTWNNVFCGSRWEWIVRHRDSCQTGDPFEGYSQCGLDGGRELGVSQQGGGTGRYSVAVHLCEAGLTLWVPWAEAAGTQFSGRDGEARVRTGL